MDPRSMKSLQAGEGKRQRRSLSSKSAKEFEEDGQKEVTMSTFDMVINLLNHASMASKDSRKLENLQQVQELVINKEPALIDNFTDEIVAFQGDRSQDIRKFVVGFVEEVCKKDASLFSKLLPNYLLMLVDENVNVLKKVIQSSTQLFRLCIQWLACSKSNVAVHEATWKVLNQLLDNIFELLDSENDGVRTQTIKFTEKVILTLSERQRHSEMPKKVEVCSSVDELPPNHPFLKKNSLKLKGEKLLQQFLAFVVSPAISSVNLMAAMGTLTTIAKQRPQYMSIVVQTFEALHANLPPTLAKTQVASVRKHLKMQLLNLLKHIASIEFHPQITNLLYDLGTSSSEIARNMPKGAEAARKEKGKSKKRSPVDDEKAEIAKKPKLDVEDEESVGEKRGGKTSAIDLTADELATLLTPENVANLVLLSMVMLPDKIPDAFQASYTPIESAGTMEQIMHLARLLAVQMTAVGIGSGIQKAAQMQALEEERKLKEIKREEMEKEKKKPIQTVIGGMVEQEAKDEEKPEKKPVSIEPVQPVGPSKGFQRRLQGFRLSGITKPLSLDVKDRIIKMAVLRVLNSERSAITGGVHTKWQKILTTLVAQFGGDLHRALAKFILSDMRNRSQLAFQWLYEEFNIYLENSRGLNDRTAQENYNACLTGLLQGILDKHEAKEGIFTKLVLQAPLLTEGAVRLVKQYCEDERRSHSGLLLIREMITRRPSKRMMFLRALLDLSTSHVEKVRNEAIEVVKTFYDEREDLEELIEQYAVANLSYLTHPQPPDEMCKPTNPTKSWTEEVMKQCLTLFLSLLPVKHQLIHKLAATYVEATADIKRVVLRALETPVNGMGMTSPELLKLVESCPKGAETLVTRMLHILTDREHPSEELVSRVRDLYQKRVPDVRFLIPVLNGLEKEEVLLSLPKLIRLNPPVVKGVFNRLLGVQRHQDSQPSMSALSPVELLVALHNIEPTQADVKCVIKATSLCFAEKTVYTSEVLVTVINRLVEQQTMPTLLMRTVIQSLITYPRLSGFVMNILQRLIMKRVWETSKVWEGFIRCCQRMKPQSFQVLLQLPPAQLANVFDVVAELREPLLQHVQKFTPQQRQHISPAILSVLEKSREQRLADEARHAHQLQLEQKRIEEMRQRVALQREATALAQFQCQQQLLEARKAAQEVAQRLQESQKGKVKDEPNTETDQSFPQQQATATSSATVTSQPPSQPAFPVAAPKPAEAVAAISVKQEVKEESRSGTPTQDERLPARK